VFGESDFPDSMSIPIIFEDVWTPTNYSVNKIRKTRRINLDTGTDSEIPNINNGDNNIANFNNK